MKRYVSAVLLGVIGCGILLALGFWQVQRLGEKTGYLAQVQAQLVAPAGALPAMPDAQRDRFAAVLVRGVALPNEIHVLTSLENIGAGYRVITGFETDDNRRIMVDWGFIEQAQKNAPRSLPTMAEGNLLWPDETTAFTPEPDRGANIWFARQVDTLAAALQTEPVLLVRRAPATDTPRPLPVGLDIPNKHWEYAVTWFSLALVWAGMTLYLLWRIKRRTA